jgi:hypothetical protein
MLLVALLVRNSLVSAAGDVPAQFLAEARSEIAKQLSVGMGAYASLLAAAYLALSSVRKFLVARAHA